ncbi:Tubulin/FtsZ, GTPase domain-containing protein [Pavlovales sp. CCMP2436]|nr:Tubulin/FtsZ, GTPase domain-containing protein [Pavlovales sp. CCMP2436]
MLPAVFLLALAALSAAGFASDGSAVARSALVQRRGAAAMNAGPCVIKVIGVGGGGSNAVVRMLAGPQSATLELYAMNTDAQALEGAPTGVKRLQLGRDVTRGLGAGGNPQIGRLAAEESVADITRLVEGTDLVFVVAGMGGGTGSGAAPVVAQCAREAGCLTIGVVTKPFLFEGARRMRQAVEAIQNMRTTTDALLVISNDKLLASAKADLPIDQAFAYADSVLQQGVVGMSDVIVKPGLINVDFADVCAIMANGGLSLMGIGKASGKDRAVLAAQQAVTSPLLDFPVANARGVLFTMTGPPSMALSEVNAAAKVITESADPGANIIFGALIDENAGDEISITVVATGLVV